MFYSGYQRRIRALSKVRFSFCTNSPTNFARPMPLAETKKVGMDELTKEAHKSSCNRLVAALKAYRGVHNNFRVPMDFRIEFNDPNYNPNLWGFKLGRTVYNMQLAESLDNPFLEKALSTIGFTWYGYDVFLESVLRYKKQYGNLDIHRHYTTPSVTDTSVPLLDWPLHLRDLCLGAKLGHIRKYGFYREEKDTLFELGLLTESFDTVFAALKNYQKYHSDCVIPHHYTVPNDCLEMDEHRQTLMSWSKGLPLGRIYHLIVTNNLFRRRKKFLEKEGLVPRQCTSKFNSLSLVLDAMKTFESIYGNLAIPSDFICPSDNIKWPPEYRNLALGRFVVRMRNDQFKGKFPKEQFEIFKSQLDELGFNWVKKSRTDYGFPLLYDTLVCFKKFHGHLNVPFPFVVPNTAEYPTLAAGMPLWKICSLIRAKSYFGSSHVYVYENKLAELGLSLTNNKRRKYTKDDVLQALEIYKQFYGNMNVPYSFVLPIINTVSADSTGSSSQSSTPTAISNSHGDVPWPHKFSGMKLGIMVARIRSGVLFKAHKNEFLELGEPVKGMPFSLVHEALVIYKSMHGDVLVPSKYITAPGAWPAHLSGLKLGAFVSRIRTRRKQFAEHREALDHLGFVWSPQMRRTDADTLYRSLVVYKNMYGHLKIPVKYQIPSLLPYDPNYIYHESDKLWPRKARGLNLGLVYTTLRNDGTYRAYREKFIDLGVEFSAKVLDTASVIGKRQDGELLYRTILAYKEAFGHVNIPKKFVVPADTSDREGTMIPDSAKNTSSDGGLAEGLAEEMGTQTEQWWPVEASGLKLGSLYSNLRYKSTYKAYRAKYRALGVIFPTGK